MRLGVLVVLLLLLIACSEKKQSVDFSQIPFDKAFAFYVKKDSSIKLGNGFVNQIDLKYQTSLGDTLEINILEFQSDVFALDYYMNSGKFQGIRPILRGDYLEQSIRSDTRIFIFRHDSFRRYERRDLENYVRSIPTTRSGFPQEYLSLPFEHRINGGTSIQTKNFFSKRTFFPLLEQSYRDENLEWNIARSWGLVEVDVYEQWKKQFVKVNPKGIEQEENVLYFNVGEGINAMAKRLPGGRIVIIWGFLDWIDLNQKFITACNRVYEARH